MNFQEYKAESTVFEDLHIDLLEYCRGFASTLNGVAPEDYAAAAAEELSAAVESCFNSSTPTEIADSAIAAHAQWFAKHFTPERLAMLKRRKIIAQVLGFVTSCDVSFKVDIEFSLGLNIDVDSQPSS